MSIDIMSIDMTLQKWAILIMEVYGEISHFLSDPTEISFSGYIKKHTLQRHNNVHQLEKSLTL